MNFERRFEPASPAALRSLARNKLQGPLPTEIGKLSQLLVLYLFESGVSGTSPTEIVLMTSLTRL
jgi:hypothetical protein